MFDQATGPPNNALDSVHRRFVDETYGVNGLFFESIFKTREQLATRVIADTPEELFAKSRILRAGLNYWLESLVKLTQSYAGILIAIIMADSQICKSENPAQWLRLWLEDHLRKYLRQELNLGKLAEVAWQHRITKKDREGKSKEHSVSNRKHRWSRVESWLRRVADNDRHPDQWEDQPDWLAPVWCEEESTVKLMLKKTRTCPARLTQEQTARLIRSEEHGFAARLEYVLGVEEDEARISFAQRAQAAQSGPGMLVLPHWQQNIPGGAGNYRQKRHMLGEVDQPLTLPRTVVPQKNKGTSGGLDADPRDVPRPEHLNSQQKQEHRNVLNRRRAVIISKVENPQHHRILMVEEATLYFEVASRTIYRWLETGKLRSGPRRGSITIRSIRRFEAQRSRKPHSDGSWSQ